MNKHSIKQGDIYFVNLSPTKGHEQKGFRPVVVMQNNKLNKYLHTVVVAPITSNLKTAGLSLTHFLQKSKTGLKKDGVVLIFQIRAIDVRRLKKHVGILDQASFREIKRQLSLVF